jgi:hypothetical protein
MFEAVYYFHQRRQHKRLGQSGCPTIVPLACWATGSTASAGSATVWWQCNAEVKMADGKGTSG